MGLSILKGVVNTALWTVAAGLFALTIFLAFQGEYAGAFMALLCAVLTALPPGVDPAVWFKDRYGRR